MPRRQHPRHLLRGIDFQSSTFQKPRCKVVALHTASGQTRDSRFSGTRERERERERHEEKKRTFNLAFPVLWLHRYRTRSPASTAIFRAASSGTRTRIVRLYRAKNHSPRWRGTSVLAFAAEFQRSDKPHGRHSASGPVRSSRDLGRVRRRLATGVFFPVRRLSAILSSRPTIDPLRNDAARLWHVRRYVRGIFNSRRERLEGTTNRPCGTLPCRRENRSSGIFRDGHNGIAKLYAQHNTRRPRSSFYSVPVVRWCIFGWDSSDS